jgi:hypothetical protein
MKLKDQAAGLNIKVVSSSETSVNFYGTTQRYISGDGIFCNQDGKHLVTDIQPLLT